MDQAINPDVKHELQICWRGAYDDVLRLLEALLNTLLSALAKLCIVAMAARATNTKSRPYSVKSWPSSSFHSLAIRSFIALLPSTTETVVLASRAIFPPFGVIDTDTGALTIFSDEDHLILGTKGPILNSTNVPVLKCNH